MILSGSVNTGFGPGRDRSPLREGAKMRDEIKSMLKDLPPMDELLQKPWTSRYQEILGREAVRSTFADVIGEVRRDLLKGLIHSFDPTLIESETRVRLEKRSRKSLRRVVNATGVVIHTNLGRSCLGSEVLDNVRTVSASYSNLEYDLEEGARGQRHSHVEWLLSSVTGADAALVVNNNAGAVLLCLAALGRKMCIRDRPPTEGEIFFEGESIFKNSKNLRQKLGIVPQDIALYPTLTGYENLRFWGNLYGLKGAELKERINEVADIIGLNERLKDKVKKYSGGMKRRLNIGAALLHKPDLLIMDEPTVGIDPQSRSHILDTVLKLSAQGMTIIYTCLLYTSRCV